MFRLAFLLALAGCGFHVHSQGVDDAGPADAVVDSEVDGAAGVDTDHDGVDDSIDNCRTVPNPDQHDWDGDHHGDACDGCPHLPSMLDPDTDHDGVGDACDPRPLQAGDHRAIWIAFYAPSDIQGWVNTNGNGAWSIAGGKLLESNGGFSLLDSPLSYDSVYFAPSLKVTQPNTPEIGFCSSDIQPSIQYYCCA